MQKRRHSGLSVGTLLFGMLRNNTISFSGTDLSLSVSYLYKRNPGTTDTEFKAHHFNLDSRWISVTQQELLEIRKHEHLSNVGDNQRWKTGKFVLRMPQEGQASVLVLF